MYDLQIEATGLMDELITPFSTGLRPIAKIRTKQTKSLHFCRLTPQIGNPGGTRTPSHTIKSETTTPYMALHKSIESIMGNDSM